MYMTVSHPVVGDSCEMITVSQRSDQPSMSISNGEHLRVIERDRVTCPLRRRDKIVSLLDPFGHVEFEVFQSRVWKSISELQTQECIVPAFER